MSTTVVAEMTFSTKSVFDITNNTFVQKFNRKAMGYLWKKRGELDATQASLLDSLYKKVSKRKTAVCESEISYALSKSKVGELGYGRYYGQKGSLEQLEKDVRGSLCSEYYYDVDVVNCHPTIIPQMAKKWFGQEMPYLNKYVDNRQAYFDNMKEKMNFSDDETKELVLRILYGGAIKSSIKLPDDCEIDMPITFIEMKKEMKTFTDNLLKLDCHKELLEYLTKLRKSNTAGSFTSFIVQTEERKILECMVQYLSQQEYNIDVLAYDGCQVRNEKQLTDDILRNLESFIKDNSEYSIKLKIKGFETIDIDDEEIDDGLVPDNVIVNDKYACERFIELMGDNIFNHNGTTWIYDNTTGMWDKTDIAIMKNVHKFSKELTFKQKKEDKLTVYDYGGKQKNINAMLSQLAALVPNGVLDITKSKGYLLFADGWYNMETKVFTTGFENCKQFCFIKRVKRAFPHTRNLEKETEINKVLFENPYNNPEIGQFYKNGISRAVAGNIEDKVFWSIVGRPDCGKGVMTLCMRESFDEYVGEFNMNVLKCNIRDGADEAKKFAWYARHEGTRVLIGNEITLDGRALDGNLMKKLSSGGDSIQQRTNFKDEVETDMVSTFFSFSNDLPPIKPCDEALKNRIQSIPHTKSFVNKPQIECNEYEMESDPCLKDKIKNDEWRNSFFWLIINAYGERLPLPDEVKEEKDDLIVVEDVQLKTILEEEYEFISQNDPTYNEDNDYVSSRQIIAFIKEQGINMSETKIGRELKKLGLKKHNKKLNGKTTLVYLGLKN